MHPTKAATIKIKNETIFYSTSGIPDETTWQKAQDEEAKRLAALKKRYVAYKAASHGLNLCSCVLGINTHFGTNIHTLNGYARSIPVSSKLPSTSGFAVTYESWAGHLVHYYLSGNSIVIDWETNYTPCQVSSGRTLPVGSPLIKGYI